MLDPAHWPRLRNETARLIRDLRRWRYVATFTFKDDVSRDVAWARFHEWVKHLAREVIGAHVTVAWCIEHGASRLEHIHAVLHVHANRVVPDAEEVANTWTFGRVLVDDYRPDGGAEFYMVKTIKWRGDADWGIFVACDRRPACRRRTCIEERALRISAYHAATQVRPKNGLPAAGLVPGTAV